MACRACEIRAQRKLGPCEQHETRPEARQAPRISSAEPAPLEEFDPVDVLETSLRQTRALQRKLQRDIDGLVDGPEVTGRLISLHSELSQSIGRVIPTWQKLRESDVKKAEEMTPAEEDEAFCFWFAKQPAAKQLALHQRLARAMNGEATG